MKGEASQILKDIGKMYVQELIEEVMEVAGPKGEIDVNVVERAHFRLREKKKGECCI